MDTTIKGKHVRKILKNSYKKKDDMKKEIGGYNLVKKKSNRQHQLYKNEDGKRVVSFTGTRQTKDLMTDAMLGVGFLNKTKRAKEEEKFFKRNAGKEGAIVVGQSLGGSLARHVGRKKDKIITQNAGFGLDSVGKKLKSNETMIRSRGDLVSGLARLGSKGDARILNVGSTFANPLSAHKVDSMKGSSIEKKKL